MSSLFVNPYDKKKLVDVLSYAIKMDTEEAKERLNTLNSVVSKNNVVEWGNEFIRSVKNM